MKKPKIRFKGFTDDWEQRKFGDLGSVAMCKRIFKEQTSAEGEVPFYKIGTFGGMPDAFISRELFDEYKSKYQYPEIGDMLISASGTIGRIVEYTGEDAYFQDSNIVWFKHDDRIENSFLKCIYNTVKWDGIEGSTIKRLYNDNFLKTSFAVPAVSEQEKIGSYFSTLDNLITLHQRECEQLKTFKKYMLQNMFPENGEKVPKIRFKGFTDDWEQRKFGDVAEIRRGLTYKPDDVKESGIRVLRSSNINEGYFETYKDDILVDEVAVNIPYVKNGDIIITSANGSSRLVGKHAIIKNIPDNSMVHGGFMLVASTNQPEFLNSSMNSPWYAKFINTYVVGGNGAIGNLSKSDLDNQEITVPSLEEQKEIGQYFSTLDKLVTLHQRKCEQLKKFKKYMLQNMFI